MKQHRLSRAFLDEHLVPELEAGTVQYFDHVRRYLFAQEFVAGRVVLDMACGTGYGSNILRMGRAARVLSVDISSDVLAYAAAQWSTTGLIRADARAVPLKSGSIDVIVSMETVEHLTEPERFLHEAARLLRPGGELILSTPNRKVVSPNSATPYSPYHAFEPTCEELKGLLEANGWSILDMRGQIHSARAEARISVATAPYARQEDRIAWNAYLRKWLRDWLPERLYRWQMQMRHIPEIGIADSILTGDATDESMYFVVRCTYRG